MISIITATYNRAKYLKRVYESINIQKIKNVEWIIIDDGSTDDTKEIVKELIKNSSFKIKYYYQENAGKMTAINKGMKEATLPLVMELDSDDYLKEGALETIKECLVKDSDDLGAFVFLRTMKGHKVLKFPLVKGTLFNLYNKYLYEGETTIVFKRNVRKNYDYELEENEKFITEAYLYNQIAKNYNYYFINKQIVDGNYENDGYSLNINDIFFKYPKGYYKYYKDVLLIKGDIKFKKYYSNIKNYLFISHILRYNINKIIKGLKKKDKLLILLLYLPSLFKYKIKWRNYGKKTG